MSRRRPLLVPLLGAALLLAGCGGGGGGEDAAAAEGGGTCADLEASVLEPVEDPGPPDEGPEDARPDPDEAEAREEAAAALERLADDGPEELRDDAAAVATAEDLDPDGATDAQVDELAAAAERLAAWGVERCDLDGPVWGCVRRGTFRQVDMGLDTDGAPSPEEAAGDGEGERVEVDRTDDRVTFAWLDGDGRAVRSATVVEGDGSWTREHSSGCNG